MLTIISVCLLKIIFTRKKFAAAHAISHSTFGPMNGKKKKKQLMYNVWMKTTMSNIKLKRITFAITD